MRNRRIPTSGRRLPQKRALVSRCVRALAAAACLLLAGSPSFAQDCPAPTAWFPHSQTPPPNPGVFPGTNATDCDFYRWAWQTFLYITQDDGGTPRFLTYPTGGDLFPDDARQKPLKSSTLRARKTQPILKLKVRGAKPRSGGLDENANSILQASGGILVSEDGSPVFYSVHFNPVFYDFVQSNRYYDYNIYTNAPAGTDFPVGALELKASWRIAPKNSKRLAFKSLAQVPVLTTNASGGIIPSGAMRDVTVELVGLHVVGVVEHHPEFIWATFEQVSNTPNLPTNVPPTSGSVVSTSDWTFYKANTVASNCNVQTTDYTLDPKNQTLSPITQAFCQIRDGGGIPDNIQAIDTINASVHSQLSPKEVWNGYSAVGGVWLLPDTLQTNTAPTPGQLHGSVDLVNTTMETYAQNYQGFTSSCFTCHTTTKAHTGGRLPIPAINLNLSHVLTDGLVTRETLRRELRLK